MSASVDIETELLFARISVDKREKMQIHQFALSSFHTLRIDNADNR